MIIYNSIINNLNYLYQARSSTSLGTILETKTKKMSNRRFVIGDVHGHYEALSSLFEAIAPAQDDEVYFLGDLIDRGSQSAQVVKFVMDHKYNCLLGNHEIMLLNVFSQGKISPQAFQAWLYNGGYATVISYGRKIPQEHIDWLRSLPLYLDLGDFWLVHGGIHPQIPLEEQTAEQFCWIRDEFHAMAAPYFEDKLIITGHTITFTFPGVRAGKLAAGNGWLDIDTGVYHHNQGWLTALELNESMVYQVNSFGRRFRKRPLTRAMKQINPSQIVAHQPKLLIGH
jgi:serine/threonine protein phosphatase 1